MCTKKQNQEKGAGCAGAKDCNSMTSEHNWDTSVLKFTNYFKMKTLENSTFPPFKKENEDEDIC